MSDKSFQLVLNDGADQCTANDTVSSVQGPLMWTSNSILAGSLQLGGYSTLDETNNNSSSTYFQQWYQCHKIFMMTAAAGLILILFILMMWIVVTE